MRKASDYERLREVGVPIPIYGVFDRRCLSESNESKRLSAVLRQILVDGSGQVGLRTEPQGEASPLGGYPHIMPLATEDAVRQAMEQILRDHPSRSWWFLVNEAFTEYAWNAVVMVSGRAALPGGAKLIGEVNDRDNLPLREALAISENCTSVQDWRHQDKHWLRSVILKSRLLNEWLEVSSVLARGVRRKVFWGMR